MLRFLELTEAVTRPELDGERPLCDDPCLFLLRDEYERDKARGTLHVLFVRSAQLDLRLLFSDVEAAGEIRFKRKLNRPPN